MPTRKSGSKPRPARRAKPMPPAHPATEAPLRPPTPMSQARAGHTRVLERELQETRAALLRSIEELQSSNLELKAMNEQLQSTNKELQRSNLELRTSQERLDATNNQLLTVNRGLQAKLDGLSRANDDMENLLESTDAASLFLDAQLRIKRFTELAREVLNLIPGDIGRPLGDLTSNLRYARMTEDARGVLETARPHDVEVQTNQGCWRLMRISPYRTSQGVVEGVAIHFLDIDRVKRAELLAASRAVADSIVHTMQEPLAVLDEALNVTSANPAFLKLFDLGPLRAGQTSLFGIGGGMFARSGMRARLERLLAEGTPLEEVQLAHDSGARGPLQLRVKARRLLGPAAAPGHVLLALNDPSHG